MEKEYKKPIVRLKSYGPNEVFDIPEGVIKVEDTEKNNG